MANYKLKYAGEKIDELLTKIYNLGAGTDTKSGTVKLSSATNSDSGVSDGVAATPEAVKAAYDVALSAKETAEEIKNTGFAFYGVDFTGSTSAGTRTGAAAEFVFTPGTDTSAGQNDFDGVYPWAGMRRCG